MAGTAGIISDAFTWPDIYSFPPFFTLQPVDATRAKQLEQWRQLLLAWAAAHKATSLTVKEWPYWTNRAIGRTLSDDGIAAVLDYMVTSGSGEWEDPGAKSRFRVFVRTPADVAAALHEAVVKRGMTTAGNIYTLYELHSGGALAGTEFDGMDPGILMRALEVMERSGLVSAGPWCGGRHAVAWAHTPLCHAAACARLQAFITRGDSLDEAGVRFRDR